MKKNDNGIPLKDNFSTCMIEYLGGEADHKMYGEFNLLMSHHSDVDKSEGIVFM